MSNCIRINCSVQHRLLCDLRSLLQYSSCPCSLARVLHNAWDVTPLHLPQNRVAGAVMACELCCLAPEQSADIVKHSPRLD